MITIFETMPVLPAKLPIFLLPDIILLPCVSQTLTVNSNTNKLLVNSQSTVTSKTNIIGVACSVEIGTVGTASFMRKMENSSVMLSGFARFRIDKISKDGSFILADITAIDKPLHLKETIKDPEVPDLVDQIFKIIQNLFDSVTSKIVQVALKRVPVYFLAEACCNLFMMSFDEKLELLNTVDVKNKLKFILKILNQDKGTPLKNMLQTLKNDKYQLNSREITELEETLKAANLPQEVETITKRDLQILHRIPSLNPEYGVIFSYLNFIGSLPWNKYATETLDLHKAKNNLEIDHYGLEEVKKRILEYLAVRKLCMESSYERQNPILCLVGPPGVGKTSVARSVASTLNRPFVRVALGGISNMADIRGHRRTYIGAMPGRIIQAVKNSGVKNPVILLDEIDKMVVGIHGNPAAALLEVLDSMQNKEFTDHYLNVPFDLSQIMFIATANSVNKLSSPLQDRLEIIKISGYTYLEKMQIALNHLIPKQLNENGLITKNIDIPEETLQLLINNYTREAGVRNLERKIGALCRSVAVKLTMNYSEISDINMSHVMDPKIAMDILGPVLFENNKWSSRLGRPGVAVGLVVSYAGGDTIAVESGYMPGSGRLILTGNLGTIMKESACLAWGWVRANASTYGVDLNGNRLKKIDVHIHFPEGAVSKDGPSAGITIAATLMSLFLERPVLTNLAMTGEITLQGLALPVGGIKDKIIAAYKDGFTKIIIPKENAKNLHDIPSNIKDKLNIILVSDMHSVMEAAFEGGVNLLLPEQYLKAKL